MGDSFAQRLYVFPWAPYPRRVLLYLKEKGIESAFDIPEIPVSSMGSFGKAPGQPEGTLPILETAPGRFIRQSLAILEYLEDTHPQAPAMRGSTPELAARVREVIQMLDEASTTFTLYARNASKIFEDRVRAEDGGDGQSEEAAKKALARTHFCLRKAEELSDSEGDWLVDIGNGKRPTMADCVLLAFHQYANGFYGVDVLAEHPRLRRSAVAFEAREAGRDNPAPEWIMKNARVVSVR